MKDAQRKIRVSYREDDELTAPDTDKEIAIPDYESELAAIMEQTEGAPLYTHMTRLPDET